MEKMLYAREYNEFLVSWCLQCRNRCLVPQSSRLVEVGKDQSRVSWHRVLRAVSSLGWSMSKDGETLTCLDTLLPV